MSKFLTVNGITESAYESYFSYTLSDNNLFSLTDYKVLKSQKRYYFRCSKILSDGKIRIFYNTSECRPLISLIRNSDSQKLFSALSRTFKAIVFTENNGFLRSENLMLSFDRIFFDVKTGEARLIYLPLNSRSEKDNISDFRFRLAETISAMPCFSRPQVSALCRCLENEEYSLRQIQEMLENMGSPAPAPVTGMQNSVQNKKQPVLRLRSDATGIDFTVNKAQYVIGRKSKTAEVDGVITDNPSVSRAHCEIKYENGSYFIMDRESTHGTFVNGTRIRPYSPYGIRNGDSVRLASSSFSVIITEG